MCPDANLTDFVSGLSDNSAQRERMKPFAKRAAVLTLAALAGLTASGARADDNEGHGNACGESEDHDRAFVAVTEEQILPLATILETLTPQFGSALIEIEFECSDGVYIYVFEIRTPQGRIVEVKVDAVTGLIIPDED